MAGIVRQGESRGPGVRTAARTVVFLDYQNAYHRARHTFGLEHGHSVGGQVDPWRLGSLIMHRAPHARDLTQVRVYRGQPDPSRDPRGYAAFERQRAAWQADAGKRVLLLSRPLKYPPDWPRSPGREKGIDVALAVDLVSMGIRGQFDVAIVVSTDSDLEPALEAILELHGRPFPRCEVAGWATPGQWAPRIGGRHRQIWFHRLFEDDYSEVHDPTDYTLP
jgi:hypothetical protein